MAVVSAIPEPVPHLFCFGYGYTARALARRLRDAGWAISGSGRNDGTLTALAADGAGAWQFDRQQPLADAGAVLAEATHLLSSVPPDAASDPVLDCHAGAIAAMPKLRWIGYLSTTGVYGDTGGALIDETAPLRPTAQRSVRRATAERAWLALHEERGLPVQVFRLAGIYGPGRNPLDQARRGEARRIDRPGHLFSRIHVDDIAAVVQASINHPNPGRIYNVCDDEAAAPADVTAFACRLLGVEPPPLVPFETAAASMSAMALSFWRDNRRVDNTRMKRELAVRLRYPTYREGLTALATVQEAGDGA